MFSRFKHAKKEVDVNLIPVMNLFVTLIPFMLLGTAFHHVGVIPTTFPSQTDQKSDVATELQSVTVDLLVGKKLIQVSASNPNIPEEELAILNFSLEQKDGEFDYQLLSQALHAIKKRYAKSDTVIVLPADGVPYEQIIRILDAARELVIDKNTRQEKSIPLFPVVVLSRKV
ncbi:biopolymer transporter ExbD [Myxococcota bacterium]|nr:biopolymer transporter ExbD [Myxococcota bacterium]